MNAITEYDVIKFAKLEELIVQVNAKIKEGWVLQGSVQVQTQPSPGGGGYLSYLQAMAR